MAAPPRLRGGRRGAIRGASLSEAHSCRQRLQLHAIAALVHLAFATGTLDIAHGEECLIDGNCASQGGSSLALLQQSVGRRLLSARHNVAGEELEGSVVVKPHSGPFASRKHCYSVKVGPLDTHMSKCYPDLMLVGTSKSGSTSIAAYMLAHPQVIMQSSTGGLYDIPLAEQALHNKDPLWESDIFDRHFDSDAKVMYANSATTPAVPTDRVGESLLLQYRPSYFYNPDVPFRIARLLPNARSIKFVSVIREPAARAMSGYEYHRFMDWRTFKQVLNDGFSQRHRLEACYAAELAKASGADPPRKHVDELPPDRHWDVVNRCFWERKDTHDRTAPEGSFFDLMHAHVDKGVYIDQVRRWYSLFGKENVFVFSIEEWSKDPVGMYQKLADFAGYEAVGPNGFSSLAELNATLSVQYNDGDIVPLPPAEKSKEDRERLAEFYKPYDKELFALLGRRLW